MWDRKGVMALAVGALLLGGCGSTASIFKRDGTRTEARIVGSNEKEIIIKTYAGTDTIPREEITEINHPGNVSGNIGAVIAVVGMLDVAVSGVLIATADPDADTGFLWGTMAGGGVWAVTGGIMALEGHSRYRKSHLNSIAEAPLPWRTAGPAPVAPERRRAPSAGLALTSSF